jgi:hypothetical protein
MTLSTAMNDQITDAVTQTNVKVIAESPAVAIASQILSLSHAHALMAYNAVSSQYQSQVLALSGVAAGAALGADVSSLQVLSSRVSSLEQSVNLSNIEQSLNSRLQTLEMMTKFRSNPYGG